VIPPGLAEAGTTARRGAALARGLSAGRRSGCALASPDGGAFWTDLENVFIAWPPPAAARRHERWLIACIGLQASPTKEAVAALEWQSFTAREHAALQLCEGAAALGWISAMWPGLEPAIAVLAGGLEPEPWEGITGAELVDRARRLARARRGALPVPVVLGELHLRGEPSSALDAVRRRFAVRARRIGDALERVGGRVGEPIAVEEAEAHEVAVAVMCVSERDEPPLGDRLGDRVHRVRELDDLAPVLGDVHHRLAA
jgi:hypothetical protein